MEIYLEIRTPQMHRTYEGILKKMELRGDHTIFVIKQFSGKGAIISAFNDHIVMCNVLDPNSIAA